MYEIELVIPQEQHAEQVMAYRKEFLSDLSQLAGGCGLREKETYPEWLAHVRMMADPAQVPSHWVVSTACLAVRKSDGKVVGMVDIRHTLNEGLFQTGGHIGYSVHPQERRKGYAKQMLALALARCRDLGIEKALVTCDSENIGSAKTIQANGGVFENEVPEEGRMTQRYWITL